MPGRAKRLFAMSDSAIRWCIEICGQLRKTGGFVTHQFQQHLSFKHVSVQRMHALGGSQLTHTNSVYWIGLISLIACVFPACDSSVTHTEPVLVRIPNSREMPQQLLAAIDLTLAIKSPQQTSDGLNLTIILRNRSLKDSMVIFYPMSCTPSVTNSEGYPVNYQSPRGIGGGYEQEVTLTPGQSKSIAIRVEQIIANPREYYTNKRGSDPAKELLRPDIVAITAGEYAVHVTCGLSARLVQENDVLPMALVSNPIKVLIEP